MLCTNSWSAVVFSATDFHDNPPHNVVSHYIACSTTENTLYHVGNVKKHAVPSVIMHIMRKKIILKFSAEKFELKWSLVSLLLGLCVTLPLSFTSSKMAGSTISITTSEYIYVDNEMFKKWVGLHTWYSYLTKDWKIT